MSENKNVYTGAFVVMAMIFVACLIVSNVIAAKMWALTDDIIVPASVIIFPVTYIISDVFTEVYGFGRTKYVIWTGFLCNLVAVIGYMIMIVLPHAPSWIDQDAFAVVFGFAPRVLAASFIAYLIGEFSNSMIMSKMKVATKGKKLWLRTIGSTVVAEAFDSVLFSTISFAGLMPNRQLAVLILYQYLFKLGFEILFTPATYWITGVLKKKEGIDTYDYDKNYRIF